MIWIGLAIVVVVAVALLLREPKPKPTTAAARHHERNERAARDMERRADSVTVGPPARIPDAPPIARSSDPQPIERVERASPGRVPGGTVVDGGAPDGGALPKAPARPRKPRATSQTVLEVVQRIGPATAREVAEQLRDTTPAKVSSILVGLRTDRKVTSETRRNLKVWSARS